MKLFLGTEKLKIGQQIFKIKHKYSTNSGQPARYFWGNPFRRVQPTYLRFFYTFCVQIGQLFEAQLVFEEYLQIGRSTLSMENVAKIANVKGSLQTHCTSKNRPIWTQKVPKEALRCELQTYIRIFPKIPVETLLLSTL